MEDAFIVTPVRLFAVVTLVLLNGFFVASEFALVTVRRTRIEQLVEEGSGTAAAVQRTLRDLDTVIAGTQLGITMASLGLGWIGEPALAGLLEPAFEFLPEDAAFISAHGVAIAVAFGIITVLHIILGELAPKSIALQRTEPTALAIARPMEIFVLLFRPAIWALNGAGLLATRAIGLQPSTGEQLVHSVEELQMLVEESGEAGVFDPESRLIVRRALEFGRLPAHTAMVPRTEVIAIPAELPFEEVVRRVTESGHARYPLYEKSLDNIVGVLHATDVLRALHFRAGAGRLARHFARTALSAPESVRLDDMLELMRQQRTELAVLIDEYGGTAGIVTMFDLMERVFGEVTTGFERPDIERHPDGTAIVSGLTLISEVNDSFDVTLSDEEYDTIGGYVFGLLGRRPEVGDEVELAGFRVRVDGLDGLRIDRLRFVPGEERDAEELERRLAGEGRSGETR